MAKRIVVAGDLATDVLIYPKKRCEDEEKGCNNWQFHPSHGEDKSPGGASLIATFLKQLSQGTADDVFVAADLSEEKKLCSYMHLGLYHESFKAKEEKAKARCWRVKRRGGYLEPKDRHPCGPTDLSELQGASLLVLDDAGNGFRDSTAATMLASEAFKQKIPLVLKMSRPIKGTPDSKLLDLFRAKGNPRPGILVLDMWNLRAEGMDVSHGLSWERTATDFAAAMLVDFRFQALRDYSDFTVVRIGLEGVLLVDNRGREKPDKAIQLLFDPSRIEGDWEDETPGLMVGYGAAFVAGFVHRLLLKFPSIKIEMEELREASRAGLLAARQLTTAGFGKTPNERGEPSPKEATIIFKSPKESIVDVADNYPEILKGENFFAWTFVPAAAAWWKTSPPSWRILNQMSSVKVRKLCLNLLRDSKIRVDAVGIPFARFGGLCAFDRAEIEGYRAFRLLIREYLQTNNPPRPLCVAVFGQPGCGKSFGVNEIAKAVMGGKPEKLTFNLSEFNDVGELKRALHLVHDKSRDGVVPLVFFDEFDCTFGSQKLGWLKHLLAPMQDGTFRDAEHEHPIGKAIFVFAGGTSHSFDAFIRQDESKSNEFITSKGPDFVSRLRGHVDVVGPCSRKASDFAAILRRATVFQYNLGEHARRLAEEGSIPTEVKVCQAVAYALLYTPIIKHGLRSIEALVQMSRLSDVREFVSSALPSRAQLELHLDAAQFHNMLSAAEIILNEESLEKLGRKGHESYREANWLEIKDRGPEDLSTIPWDQLETQGSGLVARDQNFQQVELLPLRVLSHGYQIVQKDRLKAFSAADSFTPRQLSALSREEHTRWVDLKENSGWSYAPGRKDESLRLHPDMVDWGCLSPAEQRKDLDAMARIPGLLREIGYLMTDIRPPKLEVSVPVKDAAENVEPTPPFWGYVIVRKGDDVLVCPGEGKKSLPGGRISDDERIDKGLMHLLGLDAISKVAGVDPKIKIGTRLSYADCEISSDSETKNANVCSLFFKCELIDDAGAVLPLREWTDIFKGCTWQSVKDLAQFEPAARAMFERQAAWEACKAKS